MHESMQLLVVHVTVTFSSLLPHPNLTWQAQPVCTDLIHKNCTQALTLHSIKFLLSLVYSFTKCI